MFYYCHKIFPNFYSYVIAYDHSSYSVFQHQCSRWVLIVKIIKFYAATTFTWMIGVWPHPVTHSLSRQGLRTFLNMGSFKKVRRPKILEIINKNLIVYSYENSSGFYLILIMLGHLSNTYRVNIMLGKEFCAYKQYIKKIY